MNIKLIVSDLDGTLLNDKKELPTEFWEIHKKLIDKGILFALASGRQYYTMEDMFDAIRHQTLFIAENGTYVRHRDEEIHVDSLDFGHATELIKTGREINDAEIVLCCKNSAYIECTNEKFVQETGKYYGRLKLVKDLTQVEDTVLKLGMFDYRIAEENSYQHFLKHSNGQLKVVVSGKEWMDVFNNTASKGKAIETIQTKLNIKPEETMVFGDYLNDLEMMQTAMHSYAMKNAHPEIIKASRFITEYDNNENGVLRVLKNIL
ncbi:HAD family hydrolase [Natronoflexus pectinivorans]|nr:HAD family hydrolase [Natronoflexus pectinivorans]